MAVIYHQINMEILEIIWDFLNPNHEHVDRAIAPLAVAAIGAGASLLGGIIGGGKARRQKKAAERRARELNKELERIKSTRPPVPDLASNISNLSSLAQDLSGMITNPYDNLGVATGAAEIQMEQSDIALANTLDTLRATGAGAGGATALAQAALQSKKDIAANIEQQESQNEKLKAQGEAQMQQVKMSEKQRLQGIQISEGQRVQQAEMMADQFEFGAKEKRVDQDLNRVASQLGQQQQAAAQAASAEGAAWANALGGIGNAFIGAIGDFGGGSGGAGGSGGGSPFGSSGPSDIRLKRNINLIGKSPSGLNIYSFEYKDEALGKGVWQGVMSNEVPDYAVIKNYIDEFDGVDYSKIDVEFKQI